LFRNHFHSTNFFVFHLVASSAIMSKAPLSLANPQRLQTVTKKEIYVTR